MNKILPVSTIMTSELKTVNPRDPLTKVHEIFNSYNIHHIPVVRHKEIVGMISKTDFLFFHRGFNKSMNLETFEKARLSTWKAEEIMTKKLVKVESTEPIRTVIDIFNINRFHAIPIVDEGELKGIVTTHDIIRKLAEETVRLEDY